MIAGAREAGPSGEIGPRTHLHCPARFARFYWGSSSRRHAREIMSGKSRGYIYICGECCAVETKSERVIKVVR